MNILQKTTNPLLDNKKIKKYEIKRYLIWSNKVLFCFENVDLHSAEEESEIPIITRRLLTNPDALKISLLIHHYVVTI